MLLRLKIKHPNVAPGPPRAPPCSSQDLVATHLCCERNLRWAPGKQDFRFCGQWLLLVTNNRSNMEFAHLAPNCSIDLRMRNTSHNHKYTLRSRWMQWHKIKSPSSTHQYPIPSCHQGTSRWCSLQPPVASSCQPPCPLLSTLFERDWVFLHYGPTHCHGRLGSLSPWKFGTLEILWNIWKFGILSLRLRWVLEVYDYVILKSFDWFGGWKSDLRIQPWIKCKPPLIKCNSLTMK